MTQGTKKYLTSQEAVEALGVTPATLYAYVSRGMIRSEASEHAPRERRYLAEDVLRMAEHKAQRRDPARAAQAAMNWGTPVLDSALTLIGEGRLYYRGYNAVDLAQHSTFEEVASLLWTGEPGLAEPLQPGAAPVDGSAFAFTSAVDAAFQPGRALRNMQVALALAADTDWQAYQRHPKTTMQVGARILRLLTTAATFPAVGTGRVAEQLAQAWTAGDLTRTAIPLLDMALILCADHELNASSFAARVIASTDASLYAVVAGGLSALSGSRHGGATARVAALYRELDNLPDRDAVDGALRERLQRGDGLPGFGHRLYGSPAGDPRAAALLDALRDQRSDARTQRDLSLTARIQELTGEQATIDAGLCVLERALGLPGGAAFAIFALGRTAGWVAHGMEQAAAGGLIRPRARYIGKAPGEVSRSKEG